MTASPLPTYISRHLDLGFDSDDINALILSIESSQLDSSGSAALLPAEILLQILHHISISYVLDFRLVCRGFRDYIDSQVLYGCLQRAVLKGYIGPKHLYDRMPAEIYEDLHLTCAKFKHLEASVGSIVKAGKAPKWSGHFAVFELDQTWLNTFGELDSTSRLVIQDALCLWRGSFCALHWILEIDQGVLDLPIVPVIDFDEKIVRIEWRLALRNFLRAEKRIRTLMAEKNSSAFTFGQHEDCFRAVRRQRLTSTLNMDFKEDRQKKWALSMLCPLFGKPRFHKASPPWDSIEHDDEDATKILMLLRQEAAMSRQERDHLDQLKFDRAMMAREFLDLQQLYKSWNNTLFDIFPYATLATLPQLPVNPLTWGDMTRNREEDRIKKWKSQRKVVGMVMDLMKSSNEALQLPEGAFDDTMGDF